MLFLIAHLLDEQVAAHVFHLVRRLMISRPRLRLMRNSLVRASTSWAISPACRSSAIQRMVSRVLYRKWGLIWACRVRISASRLFCCSRYTRWSRSRILSIMLLKLPPSWAISPE